MNMIKAISLFSGAGGLDIGSELAGAEVMVATDFDSDCIKTLKANSKWHKGNILEGDLHEISSSNLWDSCDGYKGKFIVIGGAPCQPFSKNGYWVGNKTRMGINDPRAKLVNEYLRVIVDLEPDGFLFENVESLLHPTNKIIVDGFVDIIKKAGYEYRIIKGCALDYGVPQNRKRLFIIGTKGKFSEELPPKLYGSAAEIKKNPVLKPYSTVGPVISKFNIPKYFEPEEIVTGKYADDLKAVPPGMNYKALTAWAGYPDPKFIADKKFWNFLLKLSPDRYSWTITAQPGPWIGPFHWESRRLRVCETAAIQTFPDGYIFEGTRTSKQKQIGNAVPSLMGKAMVEFLKNTLE